MNIIVGIVGAVAGFFFGIFFFMEVLGFDNRQDPITSGLLALFVFGPAGAIAGVYLFVWLAIWLRGQSITADEASAAPASFKPPSVGKTGLKSIGIVLAIVVAIGGAVAWYEYSTATPWLRPDGVTMQFEIRLADGVAVPPSPQDLEVLLSADVPNITFAALPATLHRDRFRRDDGREVIVGEVELAFRTTDREIILGIKGRPQLSYRINLPAGAPHSKELGRWQKNTDGSEIRYRAKWPGKD